MQLYEVVKPVHLDYSSEADNLGPEPVGMGYLTGLILPRKNFPNRSFRDSNLPRPGLSLAWRAEIYHKSSIAFGNKRKSKRMKGLTVPG